MASAPRPPFVVTRRQCLTAALGGWAWGAAQPPAQAAAAVLLARQWQAGTDPSGWLVSEKLDGVRALWDGQQLRFRSGRRVDAPADWLARLPPEPLDGELWLGRGQFDALSGLVRRTRPQGGDWDAVRYMVFEQPGGSGPFEARARSLQAIAANAHWPLLKAVPHQRYESAAALQAALDEVVATGGEGLMLHRADAAYATGRSPWLCKLKPQDDAEAEVIAHLPGHGALRGQCGALRVRGDDGRIFDLGSGLDDAVRRSPPAIGQRVTYIYRGLTPQGLPRFASYLRAAPMF